MLRNILFFVAAAVGVVFSAHASDTPLFKAEKLTIPRVDSDTQVGQYQDATLTRLPTGDFRLDAVETLEAAKLYQMPGIKAVEIRTVGTQPVAILLRVSGNDPNCDTVAPIRFHQRLVGDRFEVVVSSYHSRVRDPNGFGCTEINKPFRLTTPLDVYGLASGTYRYIVNGIFAGQFILTSENRYLDDCHETLERACPP